MRAVLLGWKLSHVAFRNVSQRQNATGLSFQPNTLLGYINIIMLLYYIDIVILLYYIDIVILLYYYIILGYIKIFAYVSPSR